MLCGNGQQLAAAKKRLGRHMRDRNAGQYKTNNRGNKERRDSELYDIQQGGNDGSAANVSQMSALVSRKQTALSTGRRI